MRRALVVVALLVSACAGTPEPVSSPDLCGSWRNAEGTTLTFEDTGVMLLQLPGPKQRPTVGAYTFDGTQATFRDQTGSGACSDSVGTYTVRAKEDAEAHKLLDDAKLLEQLGCFSLVLEKIPAQLAKEVSESIEIPTIGIGAGPHTGGQVLVVHDMLGITKDFKPRFLRRYLDLFEQIGDATRRYINDVKNRDFPNASEQY